MCVLLINYHKPIVEVDETVQTDKFIFGLSFGLRTIDITLSLAKDGNKSPRELKQLANQLKVVLESKMAAHNTLRIEFET